MNRIHPDATVEEHVILGDNIFIEAGARIGTNPIIGRRHPFTGENYIRECTKSVMIEDNVYIGANTVVQRGYYEHTTIKRAALIGSMCNIGHDCYIGENAIVAPCTLVEGHTIIEPCAFIGGGTTIRSLLHVGAHSFIGMASAVTKNIPPGTFGYGHPFRKQEKTKK